MKKNSKKCVSVLCCVIIAGLLLVESSVFSHNSKLTAVDVEALSDGEIIIDPEELLDMCDDWCIEKIGYKCYLTNDYNIPIVCYNMGVKSK